MYHNSVTCALLVLLASSSARAAPTDSHLRRRQNSSGSSTPGAIGPQIWIPLVILAILIVAGLSVACYSRNFRRWSNWGGSVAQAAAVAAGTTPANARELTADQLAGTTANNTTANANGGTGRARRPRRTRRTPSQISTHSLPAYMKEPGDQEIVIGRGAEDLEDMPIPITVTMPMVDENITDTPDGSFDMTRPSSEYVAMPESPTDEPLLQHGEHESQQHLTARRDDSATRRSFDSAISSDNSHVNYTDDAPPYEAIPLDSSADIPTSSLPSDPAHTAGASGQASQPQTHGEGVGAGSTRRRSVFMSIFNPRNSRMAPPPVPSNAGSPEPRPSGHTRDGSGPSIVSVAPSEREPRPRSRVRHRPSHSGSGSMFSLLSRTRSNGNLAADRLTSPSMISLNSISSPLSHTLVRTEFTYPKTGPTPEQLKLISSRESFARFGVPYGADAIAFASTSRVDLEPPPGFEEVATTSGTSPLAAEERNESPDSTMSEESNDVEATAADNGTHVASSESSSQAQALNTEVSTSTSNDIEGLPSTSDPLEAQPSVPSASLPSITTSPSEPSHPAAPLSPPPSASTTSPAPSNPPPSAFKGGFNTGSLPTRAASRASSYMTFETADESMNASEPPTPGASRYDLADDAYESAVETPVDGSAPATPRLESRHLHEPTDTTITPGR